MREIQDNLVVGVGMHCGHKTFSIPELLIQHLCDGSKLRW